MIPKFNPTTSTRAVFSSAAWQYNQAGQQYNQAGVQYGGADLTQDMGPEMMEMGDILGPSNLEIIIE